VWALKEARAHALEMVAMEGDWVFGCDLGKECQLGITASKNISLLFIPQILVFCFYKIRWLEWLDGGGWHCIQPPTNLPSENLLALIGCLARVSLVSVLLPSVCFTHSTGPTFAIFPSSFFISSLYYFLLLFCSFLTMERQFNPKWVEVLFLPFKSPSLVSLFTMKHFPKVDNEVITLFND
jgi:hypothetical protein